MSRPEPEIAASAYKHGISADDIAHAVRMRLVAVPLDADRNLLVGPSTDGALLEIVLLSPEDDGIELVIHAMRLRHKYYDLL